ncbi:MAG TPA: hypothetical protein VGQ10_05785 [Vicinamibacterales bacterium]|nr:hypothetical protein [Vicinamibacterales bacterium]
MRSARATRDRGDDGNAEIAEHAESFFKNIGKSSACSAFESRLGVLCLFGAGTATRDRGDDGNAEGAEDAESISKKTRKLCDLGALGV